MNNDIVNKVFNFGSNLRNFVVQDSNGCINSNSYGDNALTFDDYFKFMSLMYLRQMEMGMNDEFIIEIPEKVEECAELTIYNRWGQIQYFSTGINLKWNGRNNVGSKAPSGTYFYTLSIKEETYRGSLNLLDSKL